jgi:hypothetical protein
MKVTNGCKKGLWKPNALKLGVYTGLGGVLRVVGCKA